LFGREKAKLEPPNSNVLAQISALTIVSGIDWETGLPTSFYVDETYHSKRSWRTGDQSDPLLFVATTGFGFPERILQVEALRSGACECYGIIRNRFARLFPNWQDHR
jgi:hypothetical protein